MYLRMHQATHFLDRSPAHQDGRLAAGTLTTVITGGPMEQDITLNDRAPIDPFDWPTQAEQQAYEDRPYDLMEDRAHAADEC